MALALTELRSSIELYERQVYKNKYENIKKLVVYKQQFKLLYFMEIMKTRNKILASGDYFIITP
ncbi:hypothetical protein V1478_015207 [Vespula squamosa]|uniref:Uncharacterized protein n=1 Tax=Vespula squamosa TaxID=30214 RepID=A0ABD2A4F5_VESSQ